MQITIIANLTNEQSLTLAKEKWYQETITNVIDNTIIPFITEEVTNPETPAGFLRKVYETMIVQDAQNHFIAIYEKNKKTEQEIEINAIKENVTQNITSSVE